MIEDWFPNKRNRELNSSFAGLRQLHSYEGDSERRKQAQLVIDRLARSYHMGQKIHDLVKKQATDFFPPQKKNKAQKKKKRATRKKKATKKTVAKNTKNKITKTKKTKKQQRKA